MLRSNTINLALRFMVKYRETGNSQYLKDALRVYALRPRLSYTTIILVTKTMVQSHHSWKRPQEFRTYRQVNAYVALLLSA